MVRSAIVGLSRTPIGADHVFRALSKLFLEPRRVVVVEILGQHDKCARLDALLDGFQLLLAEVGFDESTDHRADRPGRDVCPRASPRSELLDVVWTTDQPKFGGIDSLATQALDQLERSRLVAEDAEHGHHAGTSGRVRAAAAPDQAACGLRPRSAVPHSGTNRARSAPSRATAAARDGRSASASDGEASPSLRWQVLALVAVGTFMTTLDSSIVNISLPAIARGFGTPLSGTIEWVVIVYLVVIAALLLTFGRLSDVVGRKPVWLAGLLIFTLGSVLCGVSPTLAVLIGARALQGIGGAMIFAPSVALLTDTFPRQERGRAIGLNAVAVSIGVSAGPALGGIITEHLSWRWIFFLNLPIGLLAVLASARWLPRGTRKPERFDPLGALLLALGLAGLTLALSFGQEWGWLSVPVLACVAAAVFSLAALVVAERRVEQPNLDLGLFRRRAFSAALATLVLSFVALFAVSFLMPFYLENLRGFPPERSGLLLTPLSLAIGLVAPLSGTLADRVGSRWLASVGLALACVGLFLLSQVNATTGALDMVWRLVLVGAGTGMFQSPNNRALMQAAPGGGQGEASGVLGTGRVVGQSLSVAVAGAVFAALGGMEANTRLSAQASGAPVPQEQVAALQQAFVTGFHVALLVCACVAAAGVLTSLVRAEPERA